MVRRGGMGVIRESKDPLTLALSPGDGREGRDEITGGRSR